MAGFGLVSHVEGVFWRGSPRQGLSGWRGMDRCGMARLPFLVVAWSGRSEARSGSPRQGTVRCGLVGHVTVRQGMMRFVRARIGRATQGGARSGWNRLGMVRFGSLR
jgi:hypothetical protein